MKILLTGSNGFLGRHIQNVLDPNIELITLNRSNANIKCDICSFIPSLPQVNIVIHSAGKAHFVPKNSNGKKAFFDVNYKGTLNLLQALVDSFAIPEAFIYISSVAVYGKDNGNNISENSPLLAKDPYGLSKIQAEQLVLKWCKNHNVICTILRLPLLVGQNPPGNLGAMFKAIQKGYYLNIDGGKAKKSMVLAEDVAKSILRVAFLGGIYNLTDGYHPSFAELSSFFSIKIHRKKPMNLPLWLAIIFAKFGDIVGDNAPLNTKKLKKITSDLTFDDANARKDFFWNPTPVLNGL